MALQTLKAWNTADVPLEIKLKSGQTGNALQVKNSAGSVIWSVGPSGAVALTGALTGITTINASGTLTLSGKIDMSTLTAGQYPAIRVGSYSVPIVYNTASQSLLKLYYSQASNTGADVVTFFYGRALGQAEALGDTALVESWNLSAPGPAGLQGGQFMAGLVSNAYVGANAGGAATANMVGAWLKVYAAADSHVTNGARVAALWVDNQMNCTVTGGEEFSIFATCGGTVPKAVIGLATTSGGWSALFDFPASMVGVSPLSALATPNTASNSSIKILINGVTKYIPVFDTAS